MPSDALPSKPPPPRRYWLFAAALALAVAFPAFLVIRPLPGKGDLRRTVRSLAVLPVVDLQHDAEGRAFADLLTTGLIDQLSEARSLNLVSRTTVERFRDTQRGASQIARELGVDAVLEVSVQGRQDRARATVNLIDGRSDVNLWSGNFQREGGQREGVDRPLALSLAAEIAQQIRQVLADGQAPVAH